MASDLSAPSVRFAAARWTGAIAVTATLAILGAIQPDLRWLHYLCKPAATLLVATMVLAAPAVDVRYRRAVLIGLLLSTLGDVFLMLPQRAGGPDWFTFGLGSFLFAHIAYLVAFCRRVRLFASAWPFAPYALLGGSVLTVLWPHLPGELRIPVVAYVLVLATMAAQAAAVWTQRRDRSTALAALGGAAFVVSDATLAIDRFAAPFPIAIGVVLVTYWLAQTLIGLSSVTSDRQGSGPQ